ncbi:hypothetical protein [Pseudonocardia sp.]|uniref:hypothetical protein n=1 Tax=Pseudonocardia sp. TaxID=60912 RepID=UPI003D0A3166
MARYLVSGIASFVADVGAVLSEHGAEFVGVDDIDDVPAACAETGPGAFDGYVQLPATFAVTGDTAVDAVHHYFRDGVLARYPAMAAALPSLRPNAQVVFVMGVLPPEVSTEHDIAARGALVRLLGTAARADKPDGLRIAVLAADCSPIDVARTVLGHHPEWDVLTAGFAGGSYADWRTELLGMMNTRI